MQNAIITNKQKKTADTYSVSYDVVYQAQWQSIPIKHNGHI